MAAVAGGHRGLLTNLLHHGADVSQTMMGMSPMALAVMKHDGDTCDLLLQFGADPNGMVMESLPSSIQTPTNGLFEMMTEYQQLAEAQRLDVDLNIEAMGLNMPLLLMAASYGDSDICSLLLWHGADVEARGSKGKGSPLAVASSLGHVDTVTILLSHGADVNTRDKVQGATPLLGAVQLGHKDVVKILLENGASPNIQSFKSGSTPLHDVAYGGDKDVAELLIVHGADVNKKNHHGGSPLHNACQQGNLEVVKLLEEHGASAEIFNKTGGAPLHLAAQYNQPEVIEYLVAEAGADPDIVSCKFFKFCLRIIAKPNILEGATDCLEGE